MKLIQGDCLEEMKNIPDGSVDMVLTDPPYGTIKNAPSTWDSSKTAWDTPVEHEAMLGECNRVLRTNGSLLLFSQEPYTSKLVTDTHGNLPFSYRLNWLKNDFANALLAKKAPVNYIEDICVFFKKYDTLNQHPLREYSRRIMEHVGRNLKQINTDLRHRRAEHFFYVDSTQFGLCTEDTYLQIISFYSLESLDWVLPFKELEKINRHLNLPEGKKYKSNVLEYKKDYTGHHPTQKPVLLMEDLIKTYTNEGETVLDFTMGSGTTGVACKNLNRDFIGIELDKEYFEIAQKRIEEA